MRRRILWQVIAAAGLVLMLSPPSYAQFPSGTQPAQPADPRIAQIKAGLEKAGLKVLDVGFQPAQGANPPFWAAITEAKYAQPSSEALLRQGFTIWAVMYDVLNKEDPRAVLVGGQVWTKYALLLAVSIGDTTIFVRAYQAAKSDAERNRAVETFLKAASFSVYDLQKQQFVDQKDFINKNFVGG